MKKFKTKKSKSADSGVIVSTPFKGPIWKRVPGLNKISKINKVRFGLIAGVVLIILVGGAILLNRPEKQPYRTPLPPGTVTSYSRAAPSEIPLLLEHDYGLSIEDIKTANLPRTLKSFEMARNVGISLYRLGEVKRAVEAYKIAENKAPKNTNEEFYIEFYGIAYQARDLALGDMMYEKAISIVKASKIDDREKTARLGEMSRGRDAARKGGDE